jgi:hypothetical protein
MSIQQHSYLIRLDPDPQHSVSSIDVSRLQGRISFVLPTRILAVECQASSVVFDSFAFAQLLVPTYFLNAASISDKGLLTLQLVQTWNVFLIFSIILV